ncbi:hypothetical protein T12_15961 [Trichinella patagoniensis]|uniref:Uncharacterized protein n=1 Tax=Trichinella patagoniensis TaxID=990121 RepID=A0A0V0ZMH7_9BILA|nr:hypothetical protein T12_15961 [Trichinella patagoniensis]
MNLELRRDSGGSLPANGPKQHSVQPAPVQKQSSDIYLNATLVEEKFIEFVEYFIRRVVIIYSFDLKILIFIDRILCLQTGPIRTVVVRQKATVDKLAIVGIRNETLKWKRDVEFCAKIKLPKDCVIYAVMKCLGENESKQTTTVAGIFKLYKYEYGNEIQFGNPQIQRGYR